MQGVTTTVPAVIDALVAAASAALPVGAQVVDGPRAAEELAPDVLIVGQFSEGGTVRSSQTRAAGLGTRPAESFAVQCVLSSWSGQPGMKARRDKAAEMLGALDTYLRENPTLGGVVDSASIGENLQWVQDQTQDGPVCEVSFEVTGLAWL